MPKYLDDTGLAYLWGKLKTYIANAVKVTGVKGNSENSYRTGNVNITAANVGAIPTDTTGNTGNLRRPFQIKGQVDDITLESLLNTTRANRLAFLPADQIIIEKTTDGGTTWVDAEISDASKVALFSETREIIYIPLLNEARNTLCGLRVTFTAMKYNVPANTPETQKYNYWSSEYVSSTERYNKIHSLYFWVTAVNDGIGVKAEIATGANPTNWITKYENNSWAMTGESGGNYIRFDASLFGGGTNQTSNTWNWRITFMTKGKNGDDTLSTSRTSVRQGIYEIRGYGPSWWTKGNEYAANDKIYTHDYNKNVTFPAKVTATSFAGSLAASNITGTLGADHGGTGCTTRRDAANAFMNALEVGGSTPVDDDYYISQYVNGGSTTTTYHRRRVSALWNYIKGKIDAAGTYTNKNVFGKVLVGSTTIEADTTQDTLTLTAGDNITLTPDAANNKVTIAATDTTYSNASGSAAGLMSSNDYTKLAGIESEADRTWFLVQGTDNSNRKDVKQYDVIKLNNAAISRAETFSGSGFYLNTLTIDTATDSQAGLMSSTDHTKLTGIAQGAEVNQNAFSSVKVGNTTISAGGKTSTLELFAGSNITLTPDTTNGKVTIAASGGGGSGGSSVVITYDSTNEIINITTGVSNGDGVSY